MRFLSFRLPFVIFLSLCFAARSSATEFAPTAAYAVGASPQSAVVGDFNGDGKLDLALLNTVSNHVSILLGNGNGIFQAAKNFDAGSNPSSLAIGDFNGDSKLDLAVFLTGNTTTSTAGEIRILLGNGDGSFKSPVVTTLTTTATTFAVGDFNGDKNSDVIVGNLDSAANLVTLRLFLGKTDGTFQSSKTVPASGLVSAQVAVADFNKDGKLDLAINGPDGIVVLQGQGDGTFLGNTTSTPLSVGTAASFWTADVNNDGNVDLIVNSKQSFCSSGVFHICVTTQNIGVILGDGKGSFSAEQVFATGASPGFSTIISSLAVGDFNGDGKLDVVYRRRNGVNLALEVQLGKGDDTFAPPILLPDAGPIATAADLNGDELADLVTLDSANGNVDVLLNDSPKSGADLGIIKSSASPEPVGVGQTLTYTADILNEGPHDATGVTLTDTLPASVNFVSATASQGTCSQSGQLVTCAIGALGDAHDAQITITVKPNAAISITNDMDVTGNDSDLAGANNSASQVSTVIPVYTLMITTSGNGSGTITSDASLGGGINCGIACTNTYLSGATANLGINIDAGSLLQSWGGACAGAANNSGCSIVMDSNKTVTANIVLGIALSVSVTGGGTGSVASSDGSISCNDTGGTCSSLNLPGTQVTLTATPSGSSQFSSWSGACTGTNPSSCSVTLNSNQIVTANILPPPDFNVTAALSSLTLKAGTRVSEVLSFAAQGGFSAAIALSCAVNGTAPAPTCSISPNSVNPASNATLTVDASGLSAMTFPHIPWQLPNAYALCLALAALAFLLTATLVPQRRRAWLLATTMLVLSVFPAACGGSSGPPHPVIKTYTVTVTATSGAIQHSTAISVTLQ